METLKAGSLVPQFELPDHQGNIFRIKEVIGKKNIVIFFYPKDESPGCTAEACSFRDAYEDLMDLDAVVIGISSDDEESHNSFAQRYHLPFTLLSDPDGKVRKLFGVPRSFFGLLPGRTTYIIDQDGRIKHIFNSQTQVTKHVETALQELRRLTKN